MSIYLDHNANSPMTRTAIAAFVGAIEAGGTNPGSGHSRGARARELLETGRREIARRVGCRPSELVFTSGGTESNNLAVAGLFAARAPRVQVVTVATEHPSVLGAVRALEALGAEVTVLPVDGLGRVDPDRVASTVDDQTSLVAVMLANNETGVIHDVGAIAEVCARVGVPVHCDVVQAVGKIPVDLSGLGAATAAFTAHKLAGPLGIGALWIDRGWELAPSTHGGSQERGVRPGTQPFALASSFARAVGEAVDGLAEWDPMMARRRDALETAILERAPDAVIFGRGTPRLPNTTLVAFPGRDGAELLASLDGRGICVGTGAACGTHDRAPSHVLMAMGRTPAEAHATLRFSLSPRTTDGEIEATIAALDAILRR